MELIFYPLSILLIVAAFLWKRKGSEFFALAGNSVFAISLLHCLFDVAERVSAGDYGGIVDIYPTMRWYYLAMFVLVTILNIALLIYKSRVKAKN